MKVIFNLRSQFELRSICMSMFLHEGYDFEISMHAILHRGQRRLDIRVVMQCTN